MESGSLETMYRIRVVVYHATLEIAPSPWQDGEDDEEGIYERFIDHLSTIPHPRCVLSYYSHISTIYLLSLIPGVYRRIIHIYRPFILHPSVYCRIFLIYRPSILHPRCVLSYYSHISTIFFKSEPKKELFSNETD